MAVAPEALAQTQAVASEQLRGQLIAAVTALYGAGMAAQMLTSPQALLTFLRRLVPLSLAAQAQMVRNTSLDLARQLPLDQPILLKPTDLIGAKLRGAPIEQVYSRAVYTVEDRLDAGDSYEDAAAFGLYRVTQNAITDLQLARTHASRAYAEQLQERVGVRVGTRRVLKGTSSCALCILASTKIYKSKDLQEIHPGCDCGTAVVLEDEIDDVFDEMNARYADIHSIIARDLGGDYVSSDARSGIQPYKHLLVSHEHGELGPVLGIRRQHFEGPRVSNPVPQHLSQNPTSGDLHEPAY